MFSISFIFLLCEQPGIVSVGSAITFTEEGGKGDSIDFHEQYNSDLKTFLQLSVKHAYDFLKKTKHDFPSVFHLNNDCLMFVAL